MYPEQTLPAMLFWNTPGQHQSSFWFLGPGQMTGSTSDKMAGTQAVNFPFAQCARRGESGAADGKLPARLQLARLDVGSRIGRECPSSCRGALRHAPAAHSE